MHFIRSSSVTNLNSLTRTIDIMETVSELEAISPRAKQWRRQPVMKRLNKPTRIARARALGYKAKQGYVVARIKIGRASCRERV